MRSLIFLICLFLTPISSHGQGDSILDFFDNIFSISSLIENENKDRLQRELKLFAKKADQLIALKKETSISMLAYCADEEGNDTELNSKTGAFDKLVRRSVGHLENIRENVIFESDYDIIVDTFYRPTPVEDTITLHLDPGCYLQTDTNFITEEVIPEGFDMTTQNIMPVNLEIVDSVLVINMYCPVVREQRKNKHTWKTVSFSQLVEGFQYSLQAKSRNINYLLQNCDKTLIIEERNKAIQALTTMRDKAMELRTNME